MRITYYRMTPKCCIIAEADLSRESM